jgi:uncharacterized protein (TIGR00266 family)
MEHQITNGPSYTILEATLSPGETLVSESGAMAWKDTNVVAETSTRGGVMKGLKRSFLSGESFFQNTWRAEGGPGSIALAPGSAGDIVEYDLDGELYLEKGAFLASCEGVTVDSKFDGLKGFFNEGFFVLKCTGKGKLFFNSYGAIEAVDVDGEYIVDNGYAVAWEPCLSYKLTRARKIRSFLFGDQLILRFSGKGRVWIQTRSPRVKANWVHSFRPVKKDKND